MAGLVSYGSSDDEDTTEALHSPLTGGGNSSQSGTTAANGVETETTIHGEQFSKHNQGLHTTLEGPVLGPTVPTDIPLLDSSEDAEMPPHSPYSANRALLRDLTLPTVPNYDIPASPPSSPAEGTTAKFKHFLELKKQGVHFNEKLINSPAMKNPSLMKKLMDFAEIDEVAEYDTTLPKDLWNPRAFPATAYKEELAQSQRQITKKKEDEKLKSTRESIDFIPAATAVSLSRNGTSSGSTKSSQKSAAERIMDGLERGRSNSPQLQGVKRKSRFDT